MDITVVIPLFNKESTIKDTLHSVLNQSYLPKEILIINDGSTDESINEIKKINSSLIRIFNQTNSGVSSARNKGIELAKYTWIALLDGDDEWENNYLFEIKSLSNSRPHLCAISTNYYRKFNDKKEVNKLKKTHFINNNVIYDYCSFAAFNAPPIHSSGVCIKKKLFINNFFSTDISSGEDLLFWLKISLVTDWGYINKPLSIFNVGIASYRLPENPDLVLKELKNLMHKNILYKKSFGLYILFWFKIRVHQYLYHKDFRFISESFKALFFLIKMIFKIQK